MPKNGNYSRNKGKRGELALVHFLADHGLQTHRGKVFYHESDVVGLTGIHCEVKAVEKSHPLEWIRQAEEEAEKRKDGLPTVFWRASRKPWLTIMKTEDWLVLYKAAIGVSNDKTEDTH